MEQQVIPSDYTQYAEAVEIIKHAIERCRYRSAAAVNKETLSLYFGVGKFVSENSRIGCWGTKALPTISKLLQRELPGLHGFSESGLKRMRSFYEEWRTFLIRPTVLGELENHSSEKGTALIHPTALGELDIDEHLLLQLIGQPVNTGIQEVPLNDLMNFCDSNTIVVGGADNREGDLYANGIAQQVGMPFMSIGCWERAFAGEIFYCLPTGMPTYKDFMEVAGHMSARVNQNRRFYTTEAELEKVSFEPGISVDINFVTTIAVKLAIDLLNRDNECYTQRLLPHLTQYTLVCNTNNTKVGGEMAEIFSYPLQVTTSIVVPYSYQKGDIILNEGDICNCLFYIEKGFIRQHYLKHDKDVIEHLACEKDVVWCIDSYFNREPTHLMMDAVENSVLWEIPRDIMEEYGK